MFIFYLHPCLLTMQFVDVILILSQLLNHKHKYLFRKVNYITIKNNKFSEKCYEKSLSVNNESNNDHPIISHIISTLRTSDIKELVYTTTVMVILVDMIKSNRFSKNSLLF